MRNDEFLPGLVLPATYHGVLRQRLAELDNADRARLQVLQSEGMA